jgi:cytochrome c-type biogenesis protein CcmH
MRSSGHPERSAREPDSAGAAVSRRGWLQSVIAGGSVIAAARVVAAQEQQRATLTDTSNLFAMDQSAARSVRRPPKPGASPSMSNEERDALEHRIRCQCGCTLDVYTCRTTDFSCQVSPAMHRDIMALVSGGYTAAEILESFVSVYGERALMAPPKTGFNLLGYIVPGIAIAVGAVVLAVVIRRWRAPQTVAVSAPVTGGVPGATEDELRRLEAAVRDDA